MRKRGLLLFCVLLLIILNGCINSGPLNLINKIPEVQAILTQNPSVTIKVAYLNQDYVDKNIEGIRADCGEQMEDIPYYFISIDDAYSNVKILTDENAKKVLCIIKPANFGAEGNISQSNTECDAGYYRAIDGNCNLEEEVKCNLGSVYDPDDKLCHSCDSGYVYVSKYKKCLQECGIKGAFCFEDEQCFNNRCVSCDTGYYLATDGKCYPENGGTTNTGTQNQNPCGFGNCVSNNQCCPSYARYYCEGACYKTNTDAMSASNGRCVNWRIVC